MRVSGPASKSLIEFETVTEDKTSASSAIWCEGETARPPWFRRKLLGATEMVERAKD